MVSDRADGGTFVSNSGLLLKGGLVHGQCRKCREWVEIGGKPAARLLLLLARKPARSPAT